MFTPRDIMNETVAFLGEFIGTFLFLFFSFAGAQTVNFAASQKTTPATNIPNLDNLMFISTIFGISLMVNVWIFFRISGGMFNPVVTMALYMVGAFSIIRAVIVVGAQIVGGIAAAAAVKYLIPSGRSVDFTVSLGGGTGVVRGLFLEMMFTTELVFTILMLAVEKSKATFIAPIGIGFALFVGHICGIFFTGAGLNPARSFGPAVIAGKFPSYHWIYWLGPVMGGLLAVAIFKLLKFLRYEDANGDADKAAYEPESFENFVKRNSRMANTLMNKTTKRASFLLDKTASLYERRRGAPNGRRGPPVLTGDGDEIPLFRLPSTTAKSYPKPSGPRYRHDYNLPTQSYLPNQPPPTSFSHASSQRTYVGGSPEPLTRYPMSTIYSSQSHSNSNISSTASSILNVSPPPPPFPNSPYDTRQEIPIGITARLHNNRYVRENPQGDRHKSIEELPFPDGFPLGMPKEVNSGDDGVSGLKIGNVK